MPTGPRASSGLTHVTIGTKTDSTRGARVVPNIRNIRKLLLGLGEQLASSRHQACTLVQALECRR